MSWFKSDESVVVAERPAIKDTTIRVEKLANQTDEALANLHDNGLPSLEMTEPEKVRAQALDAIYMPQHKAAFTFELRCRMMEQLGFRKFSTSEEALEFFIGEKVGTRNQSPDYIYYPYAWVYDHRTDQEHKCGSVGIRDESGNNVRWNMRRYGWKTRQGIFTIGPVDCLKQPVPTGVLLSMADMREHKLINCFHAIAPIDAWKPGDTIDPIVFGTIWELPSDNAQADKGEEAHFFIAKW